MHASHRDQHVGQKQKGVESHPSLGSVQSKRKMFQLPYIYKTEKRLPEKGVKLVYRTNEEARKKSDMRFPRRKYRINRGS